MNRERRLPSLDLLQTFVAVGRRLSITEAAARLHLTQSAVSRQIQGLEGSLGSPLFVRGHRSLAFTPEGEQLFRIAEKSLRQLQDGLDSLRPVARPVTINASIGVTTLWLLPRLGHFQLRHPDIDLRVTALNRVVETGRDGIDLSIRYCPPTLAPAGARHLFDDTVAIVANPGLSPARIDSPADLADQVLLEYDDPQYPWMQWGPWLAAQGWDACRPRGIVRFNQYDQAILAAISGQGLALGRLPLLSHALREGQLRVVPAPAAPSTRQYGYWLISGDAPRDAVPTVAEWLIDEAGQSA